MVFLKSKQMELIANIIFFYQIYFLFFKKRQNTYIRRILTDSRLIINCQTQKSIQVISKPRMPYILKSIKINFKNILK